MLLREEDVHAEYPADVDDENLTESDLVSASPGECTRSSSALALFAVARTLGKVLENLYPSDSNYDISLSKINSVSDQLDDWHRGLPTHLRLGFSQDKPSTDVITSRSLLLVGSSLCPPAFFITPSEANQQYMTVSHILLYPFINSPPSSLLRWTGHKLIVTSGAI